VDAARSPTIQAVTTDLGDRRVTAGEVVETILKHRRGDYPQRAFAIAWPEGLRVAPVEAWLDEARALLTATAHPELHGRAVILALTLAEPRSGREIVRSGLFFEVSEQLPSRFVEGLTPAGLERLDQIPLAAAMSGVAMGAVPVPGRVWDVAFSPNGQLVVVGTDRGWTLVTRSRRREIRKRETVAPAVRVGFSLDGSEIVTGSGDGLEYAPLRGGESRRPDPGFEPVTIARGLAVGEEVVFVDGQRRSPLRVAAKAVVAAAGARVVAASSPDGVQVWNADTDTLVGELGLPGTAELALGVDGFTLVTRDDGRIALWDVASGRQRWSVPCEGRAPIALSRDGTRIALAGARGWVIDAASGATIQQLAEDVSHVAFSHDGTRLAMACEDGTVWLASPETGLAIGRLPHTSPVTALAWAQDGEQLVTGTGAGTLAAWAGDFAPAPRRRLAAYSADDTRAATDLSQRLEIDADVDALAALVAARAVEPPLSVGLFGDWGSGKSFFMRRLQSRVAELAADARGSGELQKDVAWHKRIVQIEFNAWHYAEGNLWASLVEHILGNLRVSGDGDDLVERRRQKVVEEISDQSAVTGEARIRADAALVAVGAKREQLVALEAENPIAKTAARAVRDAVVSAVLTPLREEPTYAELGTALRDTREVLTHGANVLVPLASAEDRRTRLLWLIPVLLAAPASAWLVGQLLPVVDESLVGVVTLLGAAAAWLQRQAAWTRDRLSEVQRAADTLDVPVRELRAQREQELRELQLEHDAAARAALDEQAKLAALEHELQSATPSRMLSKLVADRVASDDYRSHLSVLALVRRDFEEMSKYLRIDARDIDGYETLEQEETDDEVRVGRIVLYVDDLDRCEPSQVVAVLQAVHLLLAFPLFTVVVGVDMRWVERALRLHHKQLLDSGGAEPRDYLEKIFQIPFWLEPLDADASRTMLRGMLGSAAPLPRADDGHTEPVPRATESHEPVSTRSAVVTVGEFPQPAATPPAPVVPSRRAPPPIVVPPRDLHPESLEVGEVELTAMDALAPLLGRSPRALKRFVNTYRLIKVRADDPAVFLREDSPIAPYRATLLLLALSTGLPHVAAGFLDAILADGEGTVGTVLDEEPQVGAWLVETAADPWRAVSCEALRPHAAEVVRFTFHWHGAQAQTSPAD
jgi:hypothetical protein